MNGRWKKTVTILALIVLTGTGTHRLGATTITDLQNQISERNERIKQLDAEIAQYEKQIAETVGQSQTLKNTLAALEATRKKLASEIAATEQKVSSANLTIEELGIEISDTNASIERQESGISESFRKISQVRDNTMIEIMLSGQTISEALDEAETASQLERSLTESVRRLNEVKKVLEAKKTAQEEEKKNLLSLKETLSDQKTIAETNKKNTNQLLSATKNRESNYRLVLAQKKALKDQFERELHDFESQLRTAIDPSLLPAAGSAPLSWPLDSVFITQEFGDTSFARSGAYSGKGHNGVDFRASIGTPVKAAASGNVAGTGDTDLGCPGGSYGRWVLITHGNGLSTLYAHLSLVKVATGQNVSLSDLIGYSGSTGYATGPHLHFTVYATQGVQITKLVHADGTESKCPAMPVSPLAGYLNPLLYLPVL